MPQPDYAKTRNQRIWIADESTFNVLAQPILTDAVVPLPGSALPLALREFTPSLERQTTPGVRNLIKRKKRPATWSLPFYAKFGAAAGTPPTYGLLLKKGYGVETIVGGTSVTYALATDVETLSVSLWHYADNILYGHRACVVNRVVLELSGSDEGTLTFEGFAGNSVFAGTSALSGAGIASTPASGSITFTVTAGQARRFQVGPAATDVVKVKIESEIFKITAVDYATDTITADRAQDGSTAAAHAASVEVAPNLPAADTDPADTISPIVLGTIVLGSITGIRGIAFRQTVDNVLEPRIDEYGEDTLTGYRRTGSRMVTGTLRAYARQTMQAFLSDLERELVEDAAITAGSAGTALLTANLDRLRISNVAFDDGGPEYVFGFDYQALESASGNDEANLVLT